MFLHATHQAIVARAKYATAKTFLAYFDVASETMNHFKICFYKVPNAKGASHADDLSYLFANDFVQTLPNFDSFEWKTSQKMVTLVKSELQN